MPSLKAAPGRVVLKFPRAEEKVGAILIPETSQMRPEFPTIEHVGEPLSDEERVRYRWLTEVQKSGLPVAVSYASGVSYWKENYDPAKWGWLKDFRVYSFGEVASIPLFDEELAAKVVT